MISDSGSASEAVSRRVFGFVDKGEYGYGYGTSNANPTSSSSSSSDEEDSSGV